MITKIACSFVIVFIFTGCYQTLEITCEELKEQTSTIDVYTADSMHFTFTKQQYSILSDTLTGFGHDTISIPLSNIKAVEVRKINTDVVIGLVGGAVIIGATYYWMSKLDLKTGHLRLNVLGL